MAWRDRGAHRIATELQVAKWTINLRAAAHYVMLIAFRGTWA